MVAKKPDEEWLLAILNSMAGNGLFLLLDDAQNLEVLIDDYFDDESGS